MKYAICAVVALLMGCAQSRAIRQAEHERRARQWSADSADQVELSRMADRYADRVIVPMLLVMLDSELKARGR